MPVFVPEQLAAWTGGTWTRKPEGLLQGFCCDSRLVGAGQVFVALKTEKRDGHSFLLQAQAAGAAAALVSRPCEPTTLAQLVVEDPLQAFHLLAAAHRRLFKGPVVGITGSCGKTSTKELLSLLLGGPSAGVLATEGNLNNHLGVPLTLSRLDPERHRFAVIEAGISGVGEMRPLREMIQPTLVITTMVGPAHLLELGGMEGVAREKAELSRELRSEGLAVFPAQCGRFEAFTQLRVPRLELVPAEVLRPANPPTDKAYYTVTQRGERTAIALAYGRPPPLLFSLTRVSDGMAQNAALALCAALSLGVAPELLQVRLDTWRAPTLRGQVLVHDERLFYIDCYNANPASMQDALRNFQDLAPKDRPQLYILGSMEELGLEAPRFHLELGRSLGVKPRDQVCLLGREAQRVAEGLKETGAQPEQIRVVADAADLVSTVATWRGSVFVKGSRRYQLERALGALTEPVPT